MANDLYNEMNKTQNAQLPQSFEAFMSQMRGQNPRDIINQMVRSGRVSQQQLNAVQQRAQQISGMFGPLKAKFGF